ncbi:MAG: glycosyltransferase [Bacteroidales bacterium]|jgi:glycosyltransferase involved in cell wall biosynthesis|nr:glycosyltransferase [Bacteroidales bacterium]
MYVLHIPSWFPDEDTPYRGNFIEKHIEAISLFTRSITLRVVKKNEKYKHAKLIEQKGNHIIFNYYYKEYNGKLARYVSKIWKYWLYFLGAREIRHTFGTPTGIHLHVALPMGNFAKYLSKRWKVPLLITEHWSVYQPGNRHCLSREKWKQLSKLFQVATYFTAVSENLSKEISCLFPGTRSTVIPNAVDTGKFFPVPVFHDKKVMIHVSTLNDEIKNVSGILRVIHALSKERSDFILKIIHETRIPALEQYVIEQHLSNKVFFLGNKNENEVARELQNSDFLVLFSNYENLPCVIIEAFACGKPVVATRVGGIPEIVNEDRGYLVSARDETALRQCLDKMLDQHEKFNPQQLHDYAVRKFSKEKIGNDFYHLYKQTLIIS